MHFLAIINQANTRTTKEQPEPTKPQVKQCSNCLFGPFFLQNTIGLWLGPGWSQFSSVNPKVSNMFNTTKAPLVLATVRMYSGQASTLAGTVITNDKWMAHRSDTVHIGMWHNSDFGGDRVDANNALPDWASPSLVPTAPDGWEPAQVYTLKGRVLSTDQAEPTQIRDTVLPASMKWSKQLLPRMYHIKQLLPRMYHIQY